MSVMYVVQHERLQDDGTEDVKFIGVFSTSNHAQTAIEKLGSQKGFRESSGGFSIDKYEVDAIHWRDGFVTI